jgi:hypothetical protein
LTLVGIYLMGALAVSPRRAISQPRFSSSSDRGGKQSSNSRRPPGGPNILPLLTRFSMARSTSKHHPVSNRLPGSAARTCPGTVRSSRVGCRPRVELTYPRAGGRRRRIPLVGWPSSLLWQHLMVSSVRSSQAAQPKGVGGVGARETYRSVREEGSGGPSRPVRQEAIAEPRSRPT